MSETRELFNVAFSSNNLESFFNKWLSNPTTKYFVKNVEDGSLSFEILSIPSRIASFVMFNEWFKENRKNQTDNNIYSFNNTKTFTLIVYDSRDYDSILSRDIILKQYKLVNNRNIEDWREDGILAYDTFKKESLYPTYGSQKIFYLEILTYLNLNKIFLCGYTISESLLKTYASFDIDLYIFENNPYKVEQIKKTINSSSNNHFLMSAKYTKSFQTFQLLRNPIGDIQPKDNDGFKLLKDYSDAKSFNFSSIEDWKRLEYIKENFESKIVDENSTGLRNSLTNKLFNENVSYDFNSLYSNNSSSNDVDLQAEIDKYALKWAGNVLAINTRKFPSEELVESYVSNSKLYSSIVTFFKNDNDFWTVRKFRTPRTMTNGLSTIKAEPNVEYYLENGLKVMKTYSINDPLSLKWSLINNSNKTISEVNAFVKDNKGKYGLKIIDDYGYEKLTSNSKTSEFLCNDLGEIEKFSPSSDMIFEKVWPNNDVIKFNSVSLIDNVKRKYCYKGCKYAIEIELTDKEMYKCLTSKSI